MIRWTHLGEFSACVWNSCWYRNAEERKTIGLQEISKDLSRIINKNNVIIHDSGLQGDVIWLLKRGGKVSFP